MNAKRSERRLKIGLDFVNLREPGEGLGRFAGQLVQALDGQASGHEFVIYAREEMAEYFAGLAGNFRVASLRLPRRRILPWNQISFLRRKTAEGLDILHSPVSTSPLLGGRGLKRILTVHDLAFLFSPGTAPRWSRAWWNFSWPRSLRGAAHVVTVSEQTRQDVIARYAIPREKTSVIYPYVSFKNADVPIKLVQAARELFGLPERYILHVGAPHKRKNLVTLIRAFALLKKDPSFDHGLVLVGPRGWDDAAVRREAVGAGLADDVVFTGFVGDESLPAVYAGASALVFPSLYEGFGYPPLEAMACGTPVIASNVSSLPEVAGPAAVLIPPEDAEAIAGAIVRVLNSPGLADELRLAGRKRVQQFSRERMGREYIDVYEKAARS